LIRAIATTDAPARHSKRRRILALVGIVVVPATAYRVPFVSPYAARHER